MRDGGRGGNGSGKIILIGEESGSLTLNSGKYSETVEGKLDEEVTDSMGVFRSCSCDL